MMRRSLLTASLILILGALPLAQRGAAAADPAGFISELGHQALDVLGKHVPAPERRARFQELFRADFDVPGIARFVLGRYWSVATPAQQQEFVQLFENYVVFAYSNRFAEYTGETFRVIATRSEPDGAIVTSEIVRPSGGPAVRVDWRLTARDGKYKIGDVMVEGVSMAVTQRSEFASVIQRNGGQVQGLLNVMREKNASAANAE
jgi:phospholipid transport system substrate-binding protein